MDFKKSKVLLKKINAIYESGEAFNHQFSTLEKDLLLQYLREFYECISASKEDADNQERNILPREQETSRVVVEKKELKAEVEIPPVIEEVADVIHSANGTHSKKERKEVPVAVVETKAVEAPVDSEVEDLFVFNGHQDLSNRFANRPINDVAKAMGINERILTINELFGGDQQAFLSIVNRLNHSENFEDAKSILQNDVIKRFDWTKGPRQKKAKVFIQLVKRRFL